jgi:DNA-3-methyladenine glycosylase
MAVAAASGHCFGPPLPRRLYAWPTVEVAKGLLGALLVRDEGDDSTAARIVETEAYFGRDDRASHGYAGLTPRTRTMFGPPGHAYVYFIYGNYDMLNVVTEREGEPAAVLDEHAAPLVRAYFAKDASGVQRYTGPMFDRLAGGVVHHTKILLANLLLYASIMPHP